MKYIFVAIAILSLVACTSSPTTPSEGMIQTAIAQTQLSRSALILRPETPTPPKPTRIIYQTATSNPVVEQTLSAIEVSNAIKNPTSKVPLLSKNATDLAAKGYVLSGTPRWDVNTPICWGWKGIRDDSKGGSVCIFGDVVKIDSTDVYIQILQFSEEPGTFLIRGHDKTFDWVDEGMCVEATGIIRSEDSYFYMNAEEIELSPCK